MCVCVCVNIVVRGLIQIDMYMENGVTRRPTGQQSTSTAELVFRGPEEEVAEEIGETSGGGDGDTAAVSSS